ncbi:DUF1315 family protein [Vreelandella utahensis]|uniref:DUF1315 family protein n=1 Tax=Vreelandella halophila TaxID=86177 RepID=UPI00098565DD|nr:DUF1315 family protein [Halomonas utahensis]
MTYEELIRQLDPRIYQRLRESLQLGKWPDGTPLSEEQKRICMEAIIWYENEHGIPEEERTGTIERPDSGKGDGGVQVHDTRH